MVLNTSISLTGDANSYLHVPFDNSIVIGTDDFTVQWAQYQTDSNPFPRVWQFGSYPGIMMGVSIEGGSVILWGSGATFIENLNDSDYKNRWVHFAISRHNGVLRYFRNGVMKYTNSLNTNYSGASYDLYFGNETNPSAGSAFGGYIYGFNYIKGTGLYTTDISFSVPVPDADPSICLLCLYGNAYLGSLGSTVVANNVSSVNIQPDYTYTPPPPSADPLNITNSTDLATVLADNDVNKIIINDNLILDYQRIQADTQKHISQDQLTSVTIAYVA